jgi:hypothetical protein
MVRERCRRSLSDAFMASLKSGVLGPVLSRVRGDTSLEMDIRGDYLNVYYRGGSILRVSGNSTGYRAYFDPQYAGAQMALPSAQITAVSDAQAWLALIPVLKDKMDLWFAAHPKDERAAQQLVVHENNASPWARGTDYFIVDVEYDNHRGARFDLVALRWDSDVIARKLQKSYLPTLSVIEMKTGDGALSGKAGLLEHYAQWEDFFGDASQVEEFKHETLRVFGQKRELGLIPALENNRNEIVRVSADVDVIFLMANHDPASRKLMTALDAIHARQKAKSPPFRVRFATATFMGFGLYSQNVLSLDDFRQQLERLAGRAEGA